MSLKLLLSVTLLSATSLGVRVARAQPVDDDPRAFPPAEDQPEAPAEEEEQEDVLDVNYPGRSRVALRGGAGASFDSIASTTLFGAHGTFSVGADTKYVSAFGTISGGGGKTEGGLDFYEFAAGPDLEWPIGPVRLGLRPRVGYLAIARATKDQLMQDFRGGIGGLVAIDFFREGGFSFGLEAEPRIDAALPEFELFDGGERYPVYGLRVNVVLKKRLPRAGDEPAPRIAAAF